ncbi:MAG TPA: sugar ABC transporter permease [Spirochaeta sp.]|nr:sugar ABC transporter permease [Spirochaeta sp.]
MKKLLKHHETYLVIIIVILSAVITSRNANFFTAENMFDLLKSNSFYGIMAIGVLFVLISGGIDISFPATATVAEYIMAVVIINMGGNIVVAVLIAVVVGSILGFVNGLLVYNFRIPSIITTIATMNIYYGLLTFITGGKWIYSLPDWFRSFAQIRLLTFYNADGAAYGLSIVTFIWLLVVLAAVFILRFTLLGRGIYAAGGDRKAAVRAGINVFFTETFVYTFMGFLAGLAGVVQALLVQTVAPNSIVGKELDVIAMVVLGGASLAGGKGSVTGTLLGVALLAILQNGLTLMAVPPVWYEFFVGVVILVSIGFSSLQAKKKSGNTSVIELSLEEAAE